MQLLCNWFSFDKVSDIWAWNLSVFGLDFAFFPIPFSFFSYLSYPVLVLSFFISILIQWWKMLILHFFGLQCFNFLGFPLWVMGFNVLMISRSMVEHTRSVNLSNTHDLFQSLIHFIKALVQAHPICLALGPPSLPWRPWASPMSRS